MSTNRLLAACIVLLLLIRCTADDAPPAIDMYVFSAPENFPVPAYSFSNNALTPEGFELGRMLFYDPLLSSDSTVACASCHQQTAAFADPVHRFSKGVEDRSGLRNAPAIQNMAFKNKFFWDGGVSHLDFVPINAITSDVELAEKIAHVVTKLQRSKTYPDKFEKAFGTSAIDSQKMLFSLSQFMVLMISGNARYDQYIRKEGATLSPVELEGLALFQNKCSTCHATDLFTDESFRNNGLDNDFSKDSGREKITESEQDRGKFKVPGLRNVELTAPYMHDGRFKTLPQVLDHYSHGMKQSPTLDMSLQQSGQPGIPLTEDEKTRIIAFLKTLTDRSFIQDKRFTNPFLKSSL
jgi:cytochrome c peroxidase